MRKILFLLCLIPFVTQAQNEIKNKYTPSNEVVKEKKDSEFKKRLKKRV